MTSREISKSSSPLYTHKILPHTTLNRAFGLVYTCASLALFCHHVHTLLHSTTLVFFFLHLSLLVSDAILIFMWATTQATRMRPIKRNVYPEHLPYFVDNSDYPALDVFICTADPYKEPPIDVVNSALSMMAYDYPSEKLSVYISDDGGSMLTLFAFMEAAKFAPHWLPFCREKNIVERCPDAYFTSNHVWCSETEKLKMMYEIMKVRVENVVERGCIGDEYITTEKELETFKKWTTGFTRLDHPTIIQVVLESGKDNDITGRGMPNLVYVSREKNKTSPHHFKAGALNVLLRVSATMTNAPLILTQDCDMYSNDPKAPLKALCFLLDPAREKQDLAYVQFPQCFHGINKNDIYGNEFKRMYRIHTSGMDGFSGPNYFGSGCFFRRRAFLGGPFSQLSAKIPELNPNYVVDMSIQSEAVQAMAHQVASCKHEIGTSWGSKTGFRYGSLVEDYYTCYHLLCQGWKSVFCDPERPAFLGDIPITLNDALSQNRRWCLGLLEVTFSKYCPATFGIKSMGLFMGMAFAYHAFWPFWSIPITIYGFLSPLALVNQVYIFPEVTSFWFYLYVFLVLGAYGQDFLEFILYGGTFRQWYNDQRMWMIRGVTSYLFGSIDYLFKSLGISSFGFSLTSKVVDDEESKRYKQGIFEFGIPSPLFVTLTTVTLINLLAFLFGIYQILKHGSCEKLFAQLSISGFVVVNSWPIYEAIILRVDRGKMPTIVAVKSTFWAWALYSAAFLTFRS